MLESKGLSCKVLEEEAAWWHRQGSIVKWGQDLLHKYGVAQQGSC